MIWSSFLFDKKFKWLSYNLWFIYIQFYKVIFFFDVKNNKNNKLLKRYDKKSFMLVKKKNFYYLKKNTPRFSYYLDLYFIEFYNHLILLNLYFFTTLKFYKKRKIINKDLKKELNFFDDENKWDVTIFNSKEVMELNKTTYKFFFKWNYFANFKKLLKMVFTLIIDLKISFFLFILKLHLLTCFIW